MRDEGVPAVMRRQRTQTFQPERLASGSKPLADHVVDAWLPESARPKATHKRIARSSTAALSFPLPRRHVLERRRVSPQRHAASPFAPRAFRLGAQVRTPGPDAHVLEPQRANLRDPQQQARRKMARFIRVLAERGARRAKSSGTHASLRRMGILTGSTFQTAAVIMVVFLSCLSRFEHYLARRREGQNGPFLGARRIPKRYPGRGDTKRRVARTGRRAYPSEPLK